MKVLGLSTLVFQAVVLALAIPVAATMRPPWGGWVALCLTLMALVSAYLLRARGDVVSGWVTQGACLVCSIAVPLAIPLAVIFAALWWSALHFGRKADDQSANRAA